MKGEIGWSFVAMKDCKELVSRHEGFSDRHRTKVWTEKTIAPVWSATKGPMAVCVLMALHRIGMNGESLVEGGNDPLVYFAKPNSVLILSSLSRNGNDSPFAEYSPMKPN